MRTDKLDISAILTCGGVRMPKPIEECDRDELLCRYYQVTGRTSLRVKEAAIRELERVMSATLDAHEDIWSKNDQGEIISIRERLDQLRREHDDIKRSFF
jgi:hypothetical protein